MIPIQQVCVLGAIDAEIKIFCPLDTLNLPEQKRVPGSTVQLKFVSSPASNNGATGLKSGFAYLMRE